jgi:hypothetical protein
MPKKIPQAPEWLSSVSNWSPLLAQHMEQAQRQLQAEAGPRRARTQPPLRRPMKPARPASRHAHCSYRNYYENEKDDGC